jgi:SAM-dependent methyltransferase
MASTDSWYVDAFRAEYMQLYAHRDLRAARREVDYLIGQGISGRVLDLCCGFGRHTLALRERGIDAFGIDLSHELLARAGRSDAKSLLRDRLIRADARRIPLADDSVDAVVVLFSSFGYFGDEGDREVLTEIRRISKPGARIVLDLMNPAHVRASLVGFSSKSVDGARLEERRSLEDENRRVVKDVRFVPPGGRERRWQERVRMYEPAEIEGLLRERGFAPLGANGDFDGSAFTSASERQIVRAVRPRT